MDLTDDVLVHVSAQGLLFDDVDSGEGGMIGDPGVAIIGSSFTNGLGSGVEILGDSSGLFTFDAATTFDSVDGTTFLVNGLGSSFTGQIQVNSEITNDTGRSVELQNITGDTTFNVNFTADITDTGEGIFIANNTGDQVAFFQGNLDLDTTINDAITRATTHRRR